MNITIPKDVLQKLVSSLDTMIGYADDGALDRGDPDYEEFFNDIDSATALSQEVYEQYLKGGY